MTTTSTKAFLESHPRLVGVLFGLLLVLTQVQPALGGVYATHGP